MLKSLLRACVSWKHLEAVLKAAKDSEEDASEESSEEEEEEVRQPFTPLVASPCDSMQEEEEEEEEDEEDTSLLCCISERVLSWSMTLNTSIYIKPTISRYWLFCSNVGLNSDNQESSQEVKKVSW